ncbi:iron chelate uptake ABC transporter family permease subunit [Nocardioides bruguierae]|uniref:iron chelate uptake ABC transporter family permease subunit n=1 Tax=Nocardioides bruguierae TaxID=2945102 RepID=UPI0020219F04|nr:iron chelate uptake ABC transporter family permease subunit [Nocardioides bruguierae]MCL8027462.1 iron chelate uptake ABC transporter family permease subunit [Nocardioides bruguierae]
MSADLSVPTRRRRNNKQDASSARAAARRPGLITGVALAVAVLACAGFVLVDLPGAWEYALRLRLRTVSALVLVAVAVAVSTVLFQTVTANRILTPGLMGFDALYLLVQTAVVFFAGAGALGGAAGGGIAGSLLWLVEVGVMVVLITALSRWLLLGARRDLQIVVLVGVVVGTLLRSVTTMLQRMLDPASFAVLQDSFFASFGTVEEDLLTISAVVVLATLAVLFAFRHVFDVLALGREAATSLGVDHRRAVLWVMVAVAVLVSVSTALVGPITFFGLLVANLAYVAVGHAHRWSIPAASAFAVITLVVGQWLLDRVFDFGTGLSIIIELGGGVLFLALLLGRARL